MCMTQINKDSIGSQNYKVKIDAIYRTNCNFIQRRMLFIFHKYVCLYHNSLKGGKKKESKKKQNKAKSMGGL